MGCILKFLTNEGFLAHKSMHDEVCPRCSAWCMVDRVCWSRQGWEQHGDQRTATWSERVDGSLIGPPAPAGSSGVGEQGSADEGMHELKSRH